MTDQLENLGIPYKSIYRGGPRTYARNPWDLHAFAGHLYLSGGNSSNHGPAQNAGPVPILRFDPATDTTSRVFRIDDEQIDIYYTFNDELYLPGHDPTESWELGNVYRLEGGGDWEKLRNVPNAIHIYAMAQHDGRLFAGIGTVEQAKGGKRGRSAVCISEDAGATWEEQKLGRRRIHAFLPVDGTLYAVDVLMDGKTRKAWEKYAKAPVISVFAYDNESGRFVPRDDLHLKDLFPGHPRLPWRFSRGKPVKPVAWNGNAVYIGGAVANDHQYLPVGLFMAESLRKGEVRVRRSDLPDEAMPWDLTRHGDRLYALAALGVGRPATNVIYASDDGLTWREVLRFRSSTFARSFAFLDGCIYVALGCRITNPRLWGLDELHPDTGRLLRIPASAAFPEETE